MGRVNCKTEQILKYLEEELKNGTTASLNNWGIAHARTKDGKANSIRETIE